MSRTLWTLLGVILAVWLISMAIGWVIPLLQTFAIVTLIAIGVVFVVTLLARRGRRRG